MALFAGDDGIEAGDELTYDYNFNWFSGVSQQTCHCGADNCRGALGKKADGFQKKTSPPAAKGRGRASANIKAKSVAKTSSRLAISRKKQEVKVKAVRRGVKRPAARVQKSVIISPKRRTRRKPRSPVPPPVEESSSSDDEDEDEKSDDEEEDEEEMAPPKPVATVSKAKSSSKLSEFARQRIRNRGGRPRVTKTYKVNKTIRGRPVKGKIIAKSITNRDTLRTIQKKAFEQALASASGYATTFRNLRSKGTSESSGPASKSVCDDTASVSSSSTSTAISVRTRRSLRRSLVPANTGSNSSSPSSSVMEEAVTVAAPILGQALNTVLAAGVDASITSTIETETVIDSTSVGVLSSIPVTV
jgi:[histone H3]-lysine4 N-trimethyltransferase ASH1L